MTYGQYIKIVLFVEIAFFVFALVAGWPLKEILFGIGGFLALALAILYLLTRGEE